MTIQAKPYKIDLFMFVSEFIFLSAFNDKVTF